MDDFFSQVYKLVRKVPSGKVTTYGAIARCLGTPGSARMVGWAMNASHTCGHYVPAHRVVNRNGLLTGKLHFDTPDAMRELLENEGVVVIENQIVGFDQCFWDPSELIDETD